MAKSKKTKLSKKSEGEFHYPWYLREWLISLEVSQADLERMTELSKATVSALINGKQQYNQSHIDRIAWELKIRPYELLMPPREAGAIRNIIKGNADLDALRSAVSDEPAALRLWRTK
jgi:transcriptional regulator with XRE-family HTH domain